MDDSENCTLNDNMAPKARKSKPMSTGRDIESLISAMASENPLELQYELGIDEAGRGPVLGSLVYCALWWPIKYKQELEQLGFDDSKITKEEDREKLKRLIDRLCQTKCVGYSLQQLKSTEISKNMLFKTKHQSLNDISQQAAAKALCTAHKKKYKVTHIYVDTVGSSQKYKDYLASSFKSAGGSITKIVVCPKADGIYKVVGAASICAKVHRDQILKNWWFSEQLDFKFQLGSGYPSDPKTKHWLDKNKHPIFGYPHLVRFSWATITNSLLDTILLKMFNLQQEQERSNFEYIKYPKYKQIKSMINNKEVVVRLQPLEDKFHEDLFSVLSQLKSIQQ